MENTWHQIKGNKKQVKPLVQTQLLGISDPHFSVVRIPLLGMGEAGEAPSNLAADSRDTGPKRTRVSPPMERPAQSSRNPQPGACFLLNSQARLPSREKLD